MDGQYIPNEDIDDEDDKTYNFRKASPNSKLVCAISIKLPIVARIRPVVAYFVQLGQG